MTSATRRKIRRQERGFTLIELGIVIAVIAVLATVVLLGRGFISASRMTKAMEAVNTVRKGASTVAGLRGGTFPTTATTNQIGTMGGRNLLPVAPTATTWSVNTDYQISSVLFGSSAGANHVLIQVTAPNPTSAADIYQSALSDQTFDTTAPSVFTTCTTTAPTTATVNLCYQL